MIDTLREWATLVLTAVVAGATFATAFFIWRDRKQPIEFDATKERDGLLRCQLTFHNTTSHKIVMEQIEVTRPRDLTVFEDIRRPAEGQTIIRLNREVAPNNSASVTFYVKSATAIRKLRAIFSVSRRLRAIRTSRYTIKRTIND